ncbi:hypothetical protein P4H42_05905 [Paenibacillus macerans]|uniref:hypothetical protein n=1 Tax=Paenibacillus macerans TaxID=44252 RepID=UPI002DBFD768|nr:hypothetical protein [Paenibacillus macerans]MEC0329156.1 hypothetical protein [Paenibacillus macerans]
MSSLIENELANNLIEKYNRDGAALKSKYRSEDDKFIFGQGNDSYLNTKVEVNECIYMITRNNEKTKMLINLLTINLCSAFESFLFELLEYYLRNFPEYINNSQKNVRLQEVFKFNSIDEIKEDLITREIIDYGYYSLDKQITALEKNYKVEFNFSSESRMARRIFTKRNCIVHNQGLVSKDLFEMFIDEQKSRNNIGEPINTSEFEFSEEIHLLNLMGTRIITTIQTKISKQFGEGMNIR